MGMVVVLVMPSSICTRLTTSFPRSSIDGALTRTTTS